MKIIWIVPGFQSDEADRGIPALTDLAYRVAARHDLTIFALQHPARQDRYRIGPIEVHSFQPGRLDRLARALWAVRREPGDLTHAFWAAQPALVGVLAKTLSCRPLVVSCMGGEPAALPEIGYGAALKRLDRVYLRLAVSGANVITAGSRFQADLLTARFGTKLQPRLMPLGIDLDRFQPGSPRALSPRPKVLAVGSLLPVKGHARLIEAVEELPQVNLRIVGEGPERPRLESLIVRLGLTERVTLAGAVDASQMPAEYAAADILALPSYYESQCVALLEGLAVGLPVVAAPVGFAPELLADRQAGELATYNTPSALATALQRLVAVPPNGPLYKWPLVRLPPALVSMCAANACWPCTTS